MQQFFTMFEPQTLAEYRAPCTRNGQPTGVPFNLVDVNSTQVSEGEEKKRERERNTIKGRWGMVTPLSKF